MGEGEIVTGAEAVLPLDTLDHVEAADHPAHGGAGADPEHHDSVDTSICKDGFISEKLKELMSATIAGFNLEGPVKIEDALKLMRINWARKGERGDEQYKKYDDKSEEIYKLAGELGFCKAIEASGRFDFAFVHGSFAFERFSALFDAIKSGVEVGEIVVATTKSIEVLSDEAQGLGYEPNELGYMKFIFDKLLAEKFDPSEQELIIAKTTFIDTPKPESAPRAQTGHTIIAFIEGFKIPEGSEILGVSNQPYVQYQDDILRVLCKHAGAKVKVTNFGAALEGSLHPMVMLDSILRSVLLELIKYKQNSESESDKRDADAMIKHYALGSPL